MLIADDEPALRVALADLLAHEDEVVLIGSAGDADEAIRLAVDQHPDVALVDVKMPAGGGPRAAREIMRLSPDTRVIALSAFEDRPTVLEMLRAGAVGYLVKGTAGEEILGSIQKVMAGGASLSSEVIAGIVHELTQQLRREEAGARSATPAAARSSGSWRARACPWCSSPSSSSRPGSHRGGRGARPVPFAARFAHPTSGSPRRCHWRWACSWSSPPSTRRCASWTGCPSGAYLAVNCSHRAATSRRTWRVCWNRTPAGSCWRSPSTRPSRTTTAWCRRSHPCATMGARIAIDDAGAGFASLRHTLQITPDIVKMDMSLTRGIDTDRAKRALASALVSFADEMDMCMVAEGIETAEELATLRELGVRYGQGFYLAEPAPLA